MGIGLRLLGAAVDSLCCSTYSLSGCAFGMGRVASDFWSKERVTGLLVFIVGLYWFAGGTVQFTGLTS